MSGQSLLTTGRFQEAKFHWPLSGNQSWKATVASVPLGDGGENRERPFAADPKIGKLPFVMRWCYSGLEGRYAAVADGGQDLLAGRTRPPADANDAQILRL